MKKGVERFTEVNPGVSCEVLEVPDTTTKVQAALVGKQPKPNIFIGRPDFFRNGLVEPLMTKYFEPDWVRSEFDFTPAWFWGGDTYQISPGALMTAGLYNKKLWQEAGLTDGDIPRTWDELLEIAKKLTKYDASGNVEVAGFSFHAEAFRIARDWYGQYGEHFYDDELGRNIDTVGFRKFMEYYLRVLQEEKVDSPQMPGYLESLPGDVGAMTVNKGWLVGAYRTSYPDFEFGVFPTPLPADRPDNGWWGVVDDVWAGYSVNPFASDAEKEAANALLRYLHGDEEFNVGWCVGSGAVPTLLKIRDRPEFEDPVLQAFMLTAPYRGPLGVEEIPRQREVVNAALDSLLQGTSIDDAIARAVDEMAIIMEQNAGTEFLLFEQDYAPPSDLSRLEEWISGEIAYPFG